jgi:hypothetical protein
MVVMERRPDLAKGQVAPPIEGALIKLERYGPSFVVFGDAPIGGKGKVLDVAQAKIDDSTPHGYELLATVKIPIVGGGTAMYKVTHRVKEPRATITEGP